MEMGSTQKGKLGEFFVFGELIRRGYELYLPVIDTGVDAVVRLGDRTHVDIQVKTTQQENQAGYFNVYDLEPRDNLFIICVDMSEAKMKEYKGQPEVWVLPSRVYMEHATASRVKDKEWIRYLLPLPDGSRKHGNVPRRELLKCYCASTNDDAWEGLREAGMRE